MDVEIFGPVAAVMTFRTPEEAVQIANHTRYGLAATVWSENINLALDTAARVKAGVVWINATNLFDAAAGFGGYRESGFGREGGREGMHEYLVPGMGSGPEARSQKQGRPPLSVPSRAGERAFGDRPHGQALYRRQAGAARFRLFLFRLRSKGQGHRPGGPRQPQGHPQRGRSRRQGLGLVLGHGPQPRPGALLHRGKSLGRAAEFAARLQIHGPAAAGMRRREVDAALARIFWYAAQADKYRWPRACHQVPPCDAGHERALWRDGCCLPG